MRYAVAFGTLGVLLAAMAAGLIGRGEGSSTAMVLEVYLAVCFLALGALYAVREVGAPVELVFGMGKPVDGFEGHCWLALDGEPWLETTDPRPVFAEVFRVGGDGRGTLAPAA